MQYQVEITYTRPSLDTAWGFPPINEILDSDQTNFPIDISMLKTLKEYMDSISVTVTETGYNDLKYSFKAVFPDYESYLTYNAKQDDANIDLFDNYLKTNNIVWTVSESYL